MKRRHEAVAWIALLAGAPVPAVLGVTTATRGDGTRFGVEPGVAGTPYAQAAKWVAPRFAAPVALRPIWRSDQRSGSVVPFTYPIDAQFTSGGLAIYDYGDRRLHIVRASDGRTIRVLGRKGPGPGEFGDKPVWFFGTHDQLLTVEFTDGRLTRLADTVLRDVQVSRAGRWASGCTWGQGRLLLQTSGHPTHDYFVSTVGSDARVVDSVAAPWPHHHAMPFVVRQGKLRQADDSTCVLLPLYQRDFAVIAPERPARVGLHVEALPEARAVQRRSGNMTSTRLAPGARSGALDVRGWRDRLIVLFKGGENTRARTLDLYDRATLAYRGSVLLPFIASRIAVRHDTLVVVGEQDDEPIVAAFILSAVAGRADASRP